MKHLIDHLEHIGYIHRNRFGEMQAYGDVCADITHCGHRCTIYQAGRAHRIELDALDDVERFEEELSYWDVTHRMYADA